MGPVVLEIQDERIPRERPPNLAKVPSRLCGNIVIAQQFPISRFEIFGKTRVFSPREITTMSRIVETRIIDHVLSSGHREEKKTVLLASDHPEEVYRYLNYAKLVRGKVLMIGMGLGLFPRMVEHVQELVIYEFDPGIYQAMKDFLADSIPDQIDVELPPPPMTMTDILSEERARGMQFDWVFLDLVPYVGFPSDVFNYEQMSQMNVAIKLMKGITKGNGKILVKGYTQILRNWQLHCHRLCHEIPGILEPFLDTVKESHRPMEQKFIEWAVKNRRKVIKKMDFKFVNAWARSVAQEV